MANRRIGNSALFICDIQEKFRGAIWEYPKVIATSQKMLKACEVLSIPVFATTQNAAKLGPICSELTAHMHTEAVDKTAFSMWIPDLVAQFNQGGNGTRKTVAIVGIESHICVTQTALDLLLEGHKVYILADGVSSCNRNEVPVALARLSRAGATVTTSESFIYEIMGDAAIPEFRQIASLVKETKDSTKASVETLCKF